MHWKWFLPIGAATVSLAAWLAFGIGLALNFERPLMFILAVVGAFGLEALVWGFAAALGITAFQARRRIWAWVAASVQRQG
ncbi:hypothetical protein [Caulobacter mirabilis]|uniref:Uncharacterized protein n=1 Tax=Caulobacter mirabilis TaxID=69666 RepID=A0A2D2AWR1_9CAUL|nr:hypothetical protein [Caulobacter mirabilis]ATQ42450.1 hypothetical protein CSW64_08495 [Caulobacter mirabilis]